MQNPKLSHKPHEYQNLLYLKNANFVIFDDFDLFLCAIFPPNNIGNISQFQILIQFLKTHKNKRLTFFSIKFLEIFHEKKFFFCMLLWTTKITNLEFLIRNNFVSLLIQSFFKFQCTGIFQAK